LHLDKLYEQRKIMPLTSIQSSVSTNRSTEMKLEQLADRLITDFDQSIKSELKKNSSEKVKRILWLHLEQSLRLQYPAASNLNQVLTSAKKKLEDAVNLLAEERKPKK